MTTLVKVGDKSVSIEPTLANLIRKTGTLVPLKDYATARGIRKPASLRGNSAEVQEWKAMVKDYNHNKVVFSKRVKQLAALVATDDSLKGTKALVKLNQDGSIESGAFTFRSLTKADNKAIESAEVTNAKAQLAEAQSQIEAMRAALTAAGINLPS
jgi:hypothetical protein